jgi:hypothetical protein
MADLKIVLFEDTEETKSEILAALTHHLGNTGEAIPFDGVAGESEVEKTRMYDARLESMLGTAPYADATLIMADRDLSKSVKQNFAGLSVSAVATASKKLALPICSYSRRPEEEDYEWRARWEEGHIVLQFTSEDELARQAVTAARGFSTISAALPAVMQSKVNNSPAKLLAAILQKPDYAEKIALYGVGDQNRLSDIASTKPHDKMLQRMTRFLGYWLWDSLLRYPGLFVNEVAAASYLNIAVEDFVKTEVRSVFEEAIYCGPFADSKHQQWWRGVLDDIVSHEDCADGRELVEKKLHVVVEPCLCSVDSAKSAGYYCIISRKPVSLDNSKGGLSWFPRGADLTRVSNPRFEEYGPWLGA